MSPESPARDPLAATPAEIEALSALVYAEAGILLGQKKEQLIVGRVSRRLRATGTRSIREYLAYLREQDPQGRERAALLNAVSTNTTSFWRESHHFEWLARYLRGRRQQTTAMWCTAASTGEEPYTIAMVAREALGAQAAERAPLLASDINTEVLATAERGVYRAEALADIPSPYHEFTVHGTGAHAGRIRIRRDVRSQVRFERINLVKPFPALPAFQVIWCRNVMIYFDRETQDRILRQFLAHLAPDGYLVIGHSEHAGWLSDEFERVGPTLYHRRSASAEPLAPPARVTDRTVEGAPRPAPVPVPPSPARAQPTGGLPERRIIVGGVAAAAEPVVISTLLGSCVAACLWDPVARVGGMNHFMLPEGSGEGGGRYGVHAMELLINEIMRLGGDRRRLRAKIAGGAAVLEDGASLQRVGERNVAFVREFLADEGIPLDGERVGGTSAISVWMEAQTGTVRVRRVQGLVPAAAPPPRAAPADPVGTGGAVLF